MREIIKGLTACELTLTEAMEAFKTYEYAIIHMISDMQYGSISQVSVDWAELVELRAFSEKGELHVYEGGEGLKAVEIREAEGLVDEGMSSCVLLKCYEMRNGRSLYLREYLRPDEDGQAVTVYVRPCAMG